MRLSIIMPIYNEAATLRLAVERLLKTELQVEVELVLVDDGSIDDGLSTIQDLITGENVKLIRHDRNRGKGAAVRTGIENATGGLATILDADLEYDPADYNDILRPILDGHARVVYGTRSFGAQTAYSFWYVIGNRFLAFWTSFLFNTWLSDIETCYKVTDTALWRALDIRSNGFGIEAEVTGKILKRGEQIYEVPISYKARRREEGKKLNWTDGVAALWILLRIRITGR